MPPTKCRRTEQQKLKDRKKEVLGDDFEEDLEDDLEDEKPVKAKGAKADAKAEPTTGLPNINGTSKLLGRLYGDLDKEAELDAEERGMFDAAMKTTETQDLIAYHIRCYDEKMSEVEALKNTAKEAKGEADLHLSKAQMLAGGLPVDQDLFDWQNQFTRFHSEKALLQKDHPLAYAVLFETGGKQEIAFRDLDIAGCNRAIKFYDDHSALSKIPVTRKDALAKRLEGLKEIEIANRRPAPGDKPKGTSADLRADKPSGAQVLDAAKPPAANGSAKPAPLFPATAAGTGH